MSLSCSPTGEVETEEGVLVIRRIYVGMRLVALEQARATVERTHGIYAMRTRGRRKGLRIKVVDDQPGLFHE